MSGKRLFVAGAITGTVVTTAAIYHFALRPMTLAAELSAQAGFMLLTARAEGR